MIYLALEAVLSNSRSVLYVKLTPGWVLNGVNFDLIQKIGPKVKGGHSSTKLW